MIKVNIEQRSEAWYDIRCGRVTGTRFKDLVAGENTDTYKNLVMDITSEIITHRQEETYTNAIMGRGTELEGVAREEYSQLTGVRVDEVGFILPDEDSPYHDWIGVSPDGITPDGMIEVKCPLMRTHLGYLIADKLPSEYRHQVQGQLFVTRLPYCDFVSYAKGMKLFVVRVEPDAEQHKEYEVRLQKLISDVNIKLLNYNCYDE